MTSQHSEGLKTLLEDNYYHNTYGINLDLKRTVLAIWSCKKQGKYVHDFILFLHLQIPSTANLFHGEFYFVSLQSCACTCYLYGGHILKIILKCLSFVVFLLGPNRYHMVQGSTQFKVWFKCISNLSNTSLQNSF